MTVTKGCLQTSEIICSGRVLRVMKKSKKFMTKSSRYLKLSRPASEKVDQGCWKMGSGGDPEYHPSDGKY